MAKQLMADNDLVDSNVHGTSPLWPTASRFEYGTINSITSNMFCELPAAVQCRNGSGLHIRSVPPCGSKMESSTLTREESIAKELLQAKRSAMTAMGHGKDTLEMLDEQEETLREIEDTLEANAHTVDKSMVTLRGMTWSGYLYNQCVNTKEAILGVNAAVSTPPPTKPVIQSLPPVSVETMASNAGLGSLASARDKDDLAEISSAVATLHKMGLEIGQQLDSHTSTMDTIAEKTDLLTEKTLAVTIKASQLRDRTRSAKAQFGGVYQFVDTITGKFLAVSEGRLTLSDKHNRSTYFNCYVKESNLFAMQSEKSLKYVGCAMLGHITAESTYFGTQEECYIDFKAKSTGILFIARHWGAGAWLKRPAPAATTSGNAGETPAVQYLTETTTGIEDKVDFIEFRAVKLTAKDKVVD